MIINWLVSKVQQFLAASDTEFDELNFSFDFALSPEIMSLLYAQNDECMDAGDEAMQEADQKAEDASLTVTTQFALDEHELALA